MVKMYGPSISDPNKIINRDVPDNDVGAYERAGYKKGSIPEAGEKFDIPETTLNADALPGDFPGHAALSEAGISTFADLDAVEDLTEIPGIGKATAEKIEEARR